MVQYIKYLVLTFSLIAFSACNSTKSPSKEETKENNKTEIVSVLGELSKKQKTVKKELDDYLHKLTTFDTDSIVDKTYPKLFYVIDLDLYRQYIASMMNSTDIEMTSYETNVTKLSPVTTFSNGTEFTQAQYTTRVNIRFLNGTLYDTEEKMNFLYDVLIHKYGQKNIKINVKKRILSITKSEKLLIIKEKDTEWKFLGDNLDYRKLYPSFLPNEILTNLDRVQTPQKSRKKKNQKRKYVKEKATEKKIVEKQTLEEKTIERRDENETI
ncbi:MAG: Unknown protein [uncultured Sulfurovum sp.]|uniref:Lipoprotein n=1 Tax=uncultured Sulfurovum sp. TaxID=269237 RepID=A0A6S6SXX7_9BACT|nr:MAG: Unknown protein [uncultured Sulfurovum sp.]